MDAAQYQCMSPADMSSAQSVVSMGGAKHKGKAVRKAIDSAPKLPAKPTSDPDTCNAYGMKTTCGGFSTHHSLEFSKQLTECTKIADADISTMPIRSGKGFC